MLWPLDERGVARHCSACLRQMRIARCRMPSLDMHMTLLMTSRNIFDAEDFNASGRP